MERGPGETRVRPFFVKRVAHGFAIPHQTLWTL